MQWGRWLERLVRPFLGRRRLHESGHIESEVSATNSNSSAAPVDRERDAVNETGTIRR